MTNWISVKERLPEEDIAVLVYNDKKNIIVMARLSTDCIRPYKKWYSESEYGFEEMVNEVTHWMPLPQPPEEV